MKKVRFHGGFQYAAIKTTVTNVALSPSRAVAAVADQEITYAASRMKYSGFGPRVGVDLIHDFGYAFSIYANAASALLVGTRSFDVSAVGEQINTSPTFSLTPYTNTASSSNTIIVPELEAKVGITHTHNTANGDLSIDAGWMWVNYFNVQSYPRNVTGELKSDFGVQGPYVGLKWLGNLI